MNNKYLLFFVLLLGLSSCSDRWDKDPFARERDAVKEAIPYNRKETKIPPPEKDSIFIDIEPSYSVVQGKTLEIPIKYRIVHPDIVFQKIEIQNSEKNVPMETATEFDDENNEFTVLKVTPPKTIVDLGSVFKIIEFQVTLFAEYEETTLSSSEKIKIIVTPDIHSRGLVPEILAIHPVLKDSSDDEEKHPLLDKRVGIFDKSYKFNIYVRGDTEQPPQVSFKDPKTYVSFPTSSSVPEAGSLLTKESFKSCTECFKSDGSFKYGQDGRNIWKFTLEIKAPSDDNAKSFHDKHEVEFMAHSVYGIPSDDTESKTFYFRMEDLPKAELKALSSVEFRKSFKNTYVFTVESPVESKLSAECEVDGQKDAECECNRYDKKKSVNQCILLWEPDKEGIFDVIVKSENTLIHKDEFFSSEFESVFNIKVVSENQKTQIDEQLQNETKAETEEPDVQRAAPPGAGAGSLPDDEMVW